MFCKVFFPGILLVRGRALNQVASMEFHVWASFCERCTLRMYLLGPAVAAVSSHSGNWQNISLEILYIGLKCYRRCGIWCLAVLHRLASHKVPWSYEQGGWVIRAQSHKCCFGVTGWGWLLIWKNCRGAHSQSAANAISINWVLWLVQACKPLLNQILFLICKLLKKDKRVAIF